MLLQMRKLDMNQLLQVYADLENRRVANLTSSPLRLFLICDYIPNSRVLSIIISEYDIIHKVAIFVIICRINRMEIESL